MTARAEVLDNRTIGREKRWAWPADDGESHFVEVPLVTGCRKTAADLVGKALTELQRPLPHRLMADQDAAGGEHLLDHPEAEREPKNRATRHG